MKKLSRILLFAAVLLITPTLYLPHIVLGQEGSDAPKPEIQLVVDHTLLNSGDSSEAILILRNTTPYTLTDIEAQFQGTTFTVIDSTDLPTILSPYTSAQANYTLQSQTVGSHNVVFVVQYSWDNLEQGTTHQWLESVSVEEIQVVNHWGAFNWLDYLIPLFIGSFLSLFGFSANEVFKQRREAHQREEQARGITLAILQAIRKGVEAKEQVSFSLWEEAIVKGNLYPALHQLGRTIGKPDLSKRLAELSIFIVNYNEREAKGNLTEEIATELRDELTELIVLVENRSG
jgi:hypothetical protein